MIYKQTSCKYVIAKVLADLDIGDSKNRIVDMIEWCAEAFEKIGAVTTLEKKITGKNNQKLLVISNYQAALPCGFHSLIQASYGTSEDSDSIFYPMRHTNGSYDAFRDDTTEANMNFDGDYTFFIKPGYIVTSEKTGYIMMAYNAIPLDCDGYPIIPDDVSFMEAIYWYINMKLLYPKWRSGKVRDAVYYDAKRSWNFYRKQAYADAMMPDQGSLETIKNQVNSLIPNFNASNSFYTTLGKQEVYYRH